MNYAEDFFPKMKPRPVEEVQYYKEREPSMVYKADNDLFASLVSGDYEQVNFETEQKFRSSERELKKDLRPYSGSLPYRTTPKSWEYRTEQMIPEPTLVSRTCMNEAIDKSGPWYLRHWPIWDNAPFLPSIGDVSKDPRYALQTKGFSTEYKYRL